MRKINLILLLLKEHKQEESYILLLKQIKDQIPCELEKHTIF